MARYTPDEVGEQIDRAYHLLTDGDPDGRQQALRVFMAALEDICDPDEIDPAAIYIALGSADPRALVFFSSQVVMEMHRLGWDAEDAWASVRDAEEAS